jgi:hypothetical protein
VKVLFDNCTSPVLATTLDGFISAFDHRAFHVRDAPGLPNGRHATDVEWIGFLRNQLDDWVFITADRRLLRNPAERAALRSAGLHGFVLASAYQKTPLYQAASTIIWKWPDILGVTKLVDAPSMHEIPINRTSKLRSLPL